MRALGSPCALRTEIPADNVAGRVEMHSRPHLHLIPRRFAEKTPAVTAHAESDAANRHVTPDHMPADGINFQFDHTARRIHFSSNSQATAGERRLHIGLTRFKIDETIKHGLQLPVAARPLAADLFKNSTDGCRGQASLQVADQRHMFIVKFIR